MSFDARMIWQRKKLDVVLQPNIVHDPQEAPVAVTDENSCRLVLSMPIRLPRFNVVLHDAFFTIFSAELTVGRKVEAKRPLPSCRTGCG
jgi:hypothetical protein